MGTRSAIILKREDGKYQGIYCHWDGYPSYNGKILFENYQDIEKVKELVGLGDISSLANEVTPPEGSGHSYDNRVDGYVVAYHRDRGEELRIIEISENLKEVLAKIDYAYAYVYIDGVWYVEGDSSDIKEFTLESVLSLEDPDDFY